MNLPSKRNPLLALVLGLLPLASPAQSTPAVAPNVLFLLDNSRAMQEYPIFLPEAASGSSPSMSSVVTDPKPGDPGYNDPRYGHFINTGCSDPALVAEMSWFDQNSPDPAKNGSLVYDADADLGSTFFDPKTFYHSRGRRVSWKGGSDEDDPFSMSADFRRVTGETAADYACHRVWAWDTAYFRNPALLRECVKCLTSRGWWRGPLTPPNASGFYLGPKSLPTEPALPPEARRKWIVSGRVLNVRPPRFVLARRVLKDLLGTASDIRMGVATFGEDFGWFDPAWVLADVRPLSCSASSLPLDEAQLDRPALMRAVNNARFQHNERQLGESLFSLGGYFSSQKVDGRWTAWFNQPIGNTDWGWPGAPKGATIDNPYIPTQSGDFFARFSEEWLKRDYQDPYTGRVIPGQRWEQGGNNRSVCFDNQVNAVVAVTLGEPVYDNSVPITKMMSLLIAQNARHETPEQYPVYFDPTNPRENQNSGGINYCDQFEKRPGVMATAADCDYTEYNWPTGFAVGNKNFMDDTAFFLSHMDLRGDLSGTQRLRTYVVGFGSSHPMLQSIARAGRGSFRRADDSTSLRAVLEQTLAEIRAATP